MGDNACDLSQDPGLLAAVREAVDRANTGPVG